MNVEYSSLPSDWASSNQLYWRLEENKTSSLSEQERIFQKTACGLHVHHQLSSFSSLWAHSTEFQLASLYNHISQFLMTIIYIYVHILLVLFLHICVCMLVVQSCLIFAAPWMEVCQAPLSMEFSKQENWNGLSFPSPGDLPDSRIESGSPTLQADSLPSELWRTVIQWLFGIQQATQICV